MEIKELKKEINVLLYQADAIKHKYDGKTGGMSESDETEFSNMVAAADKLSSQITMLEKEARVKSWASEEKNVVLPMGGENKFILGAKSAEDETKANRDSWRKFLKGGIMALNPQEIKAYQSDNPVGGGFLISPQDFVQEVITLMKDQVFMRGLAKIYTVTKAESLGLPAIDTDPSDADWTAELATGNEELTLAFGKRELRPHPLAKNIKVSNKLLRNATIGPEEVIMDRLAYKFAVTMEKAYLNGTGSDQPLGVFTASTYGISTARDLTAATTTAVAADDFIGTKYKLKAAYQGRAQWIMHRDVVAATRKLKDSNNNYLWTSGLTSWSGATGPGNGLQGTPEMLLGCPINMSEYSPNTFTTGLYMAILGDFSRYVIADALDMQVQVLDQLYAATNQTGYIARLESDGMPVLEEAFSRLILR